LALRALPEMEEEAEERMVRKMDSWLVRRVVMDLRSILRALVVG
jgi:hypothetical protein